MISSLAFIKHTHTGTKLEKNELKLMQYRVMFFVVYVEVCVCVSLCDNVLIWSTSSRKLPRKIAKRKYNHTTKTVDF